MDCQWKCHHILYLIIGLGWFCISLSVEISPPPCYIISIMGLGGFWIRLSMDMSPPPCYNHRFGMVPDRIVNGNVCHHILAIICYNHRFEYGNQWTFHDALVFIIGWCWFRIGLSMEMSPSLCYNLRFRLVLDKFISIN